MLWKIHQATEGPLAVSIEYVRIKNEREKLAQAKNL